MTAGRSENDENICCMKMCASDKFPAPGARPSGRFTVRMEVKETIDLRAVDTEAA
jgi:hypothetical protein